MGNTMKRRRGNAQVNPQQGVVYPFPHDQQQYRPLNGQIPQQIPPSYGPPIGQMYQQVPQKYGPSYLNGYSPPPPPMFSSSGNDMYLSNVTGLAPADVGRLRTEFFNYANTYGVIDREGFRKLYVASLLNMTWQAIERDAEMAFRNFDTNKNGGLEFDEYMTACSRMVRGNPYAPMY